MMRTVLVTMTIVFALNMGQQMSYGQLQPGYSSPPGFTRPTHRELVRPDWERNQRPYDSSQIDWPPPDTMQGGYAPNTFSESWFDAECGTCSGEGSECQQFWAHRTRLFGDFLYLTVRDSRIPYATHVDGPVPGAAPLAPVSVIDPEYQSGFRVGGAYALDPWSSITATYWSFRGDVTDSLELPGNIGWARSEVTHPTTPSVANDSLFARAEDESAFQIGDLALERVICGNCVTSVDWFLGLRFAHLTQDFRSGFSISGDTSIETEVDFDGIGPRLGIDLERRLDGGLLVYGQAAGNLLFGESEAHFVQQNATVGAQSRVGESNLRLVPQLEIELGVGWQTYAGNLRFKAGYYFGSWFNVITTPDWLSAVQATDTSDVSDTLIFHGLTARAEYRF